MIHTSIQIKTEPHIKLNSEYGICRIVETDEWRHEREKDRHKNYGSVWKQ